jgi:hypothetical protein
MLVAQAKSDDLVFVMADKLLRSYPVKSLAA